MSAFVTLKTFTYQHELAVIRTRLESEGIACVVQDELTIQADPFYSNALGGIKLKVRETDLLAAIEILEEAGYTADEGSGEGQLHAMADNATNTIARVLQAMQWWHWVLIVTIVVLAASLLASAMRP